MLLLCFLITAINLVKAQEQNLTKCANNFLSQLDKTQKQKAQYLYDDAERFNWHFVPRERKGISLRDLNPKQSDAAFALLKASLSEKGYGKIKEIMSLEAVLKVIEARAENDKHRDPLNYSFTIFGTPSKDKIWGWRFEGHHISFNFSSDKGMIESSTPSFIGSNPGIVPSGTEKDKEVLKEETELGFTLINALDVEQLKTAHFSETAFPEIVSGNQRKAELLMPAGLSYTLLNENQKKVFSQLLDVYVKNYQFGFSDKLMNKIRKAGIENLSFAWAGSLKPGAGHYYRIQGPMLLIEYDNTQTNANHVHTVVRDLTNDFAEDILKEHYAKDHK